MPELLLCFAFVCIALSFGIWHRQKWAWYAGWIVFLLFAIQITAFIAHVTSTAQTARAAVPDYTGIAGIVLFWTPIVIWWAKRRHDFGKRRKRPAQPLPHGTKKPDA